MGCPTNDKAVGLSQLNGAEVVSPSSSAAILQAQDSLAETFSRYADLAQLLSGFSTTVRGAYQNAQAALAQLRADQGFNQTLPAYEAAVDAFAKQAEAFFFPHGAKTDLPERMREAARSAFPKTPNAPFNKNVPESLKKVFERLYKDVIPSDYRRAMVSSGGKINQALAVCIDHARQRAADPDLPIPPSLRRLASILWSYPDLARLTAATASSLQFDHQSFTRTASTLQGMIAAGKLDPENWTHNLTDAAREVLIGHLRKTVGLVELSTPPVKPSDPLLAGVWMAAERAVPTLAELSEQAADGPSRLPAAEAVVVRFLTAWLDEVKDAFFERDSEGLLTGFGEIRSAERRALRTKARAGQKLTQEDLLKYPELLFEIDVNDPTAKAGGLRKQAVLTSHSHQPQG